MSLARHFTEYTLVPGDDTLVSVPACGDNQEVEELEFDNYGIQDCLVPATKEHDEDDEGLDGFRILMSEEKAAQRAKVCISCLKTYSIVFVLFIVLMTVLLLTTGGGGDGGKEDKKEGSDSRGFRELRLGGRRVWYTLTESTTMANHTVLLIHGKYSTSNLFEKLGTAKFMSEHGARIVAVDIPGFGKSDPPLHLLDDHISFFSEIIPLFEMEYNLVLVAVEEGCEMILPYYLQHGVYSRNNSFIEGAVLISPRGDVDKLKQFVDASKAGYPSATRTVIVNGQKDMYLNYDMTNLLEKIPRSEIHALPGQKNGFYSKGQGKAYFHAALQAFVEKLEYSYDRELQKISDQYHKEEGQQNQQQEQFNNNQQQQSNQQYNNNQYNNNQFLNQQQFNNGQQQQQQRFQQQQFVPQNNNNYAGNSGLNIPNRVDGHINTAAKPASKFQDMSYNPASRFSKLKGKKR